MVKLEVLIATYGEEGLHRLSTHQLPRVEGVAYLVSCQNPDGLLPIPEILKRDDVKVIFSTTRGLSCNRNILIQAATAPYCLIADDDIDFIPEGLEAIINIFDNQDSIDLIALQYTDKEGNTEKIYPGQPFNLTEPPKGYFITSFELAFRREPIIRKGIYFNENFGVGTPKYGCGEEDLWLNNILNTGSAGRFYPFTIARHDGATTGLRAAAKPSVLRAQGVVIGHLNPKTGLLRVILKAYRTSKTTHTPLIKCLIPALAGWKDLILYKNRILSRNNTDR